MESYGETVIWTVSWNRVCVHTANKKYYIILFCVPKVKKSEKGAYAFVVRAYTTRRNKYLTYA